METDWYVIASALVLSVVIVAMLYGLYRIFRLMWHHNKKQALRAHVVSVLIDHSFRDEMQFRISQALQRRGTELTFEQAESDALSAITTEIYPEVLVRTGLSAEKLTKGALFRALRNEWERIKITSSPDYYGELQLGGGLD